MLTLNCVTFAYEFVLLSIENSVAERENGVYIEKITFFLLYRERDYTVKEIE